MEPGLTIGSPDWMDHVYHLYQNHSPELDPSWRYLFQGMELQARGVGKLLQLRTQWMLQWYRREGHRWAHTNPLEAPRTPELCDLGWNEDLEWVSGEGFFSEQKVSAMQMKQYLETLYCGSVGFEYSHCDPPVIAWLQEEIERGSQHTMTQDQCLLLWERLAQVHDFEQTLHKQYVGQKRFSIEGLEICVPMLQTLVTLSDTREEIILGMTHRGRLSVMRQVLNKPYEEIANEFLDRVDAGDPGDVKYHQGYSKTFSRAHGPPLHVSILPNPSHLESIAPVVCGNVAAKQKKSKAKHPQEAILGMIIHGDAAFAGQGVLYETLQLARLHGYETGGILHLVLDNQIGFTASPQEYGSTRNPTDLALAFRCPIFHLNSEEPEACLRALKLALKVRDRFHLDVFLHLIGFRRYGHNELDEPRFTHPQLYQALEQKKPLYQTYGERLRERGVLIPDVRAKSTLTMGSLQDVELPRTPSAFAGEWTGFYFPTEDELCSPFPTSITKEKVEIIQQALQHEPASFELHAKLKKSIQPQSGVLDWATAERWAFASILLEGYDVRLSGQDVERGTFSQRHARWVDQETGKDFIPLASLGMSQGCFEVHNSPVSELGVLGFEYGYSLASPYRLTLWEAQFGDFANGAQVIIDQYIAAAKEKWKRSSGLVLLLPHGYEGQGAEHSSARPERYLQLSANANWRVCYPTTPAQYFHLLRQQILAPYRVPLVLFGPKSLLRHSLCVSSIAELVETTFQPFFAESLPHAKSLICCTGKIYYDLLEARRQREWNDVAFLRLEQLYPLPVQALRQILRQYPQLENCLWVQEEPRNMGASAYITPMLERIWGLPILCQSRSASATVATGSFACHQAEYKQLIEQVAHATGYSNSASR